jgi:pyruvate,water dikinase
MNEFIETQDIDLESYRAMHWSGIDISRKFDYLSDLLKLHNKAQWSIIIVAMNMMIRNTLLKKMVNKHAPDVQSSDLLRGLPGLKGLEPNLQLARLSGLLSDMGDEAVQTCLEGDDRKIRLYFKKSEKGQKLIDEFDEVMQTFGHLSANTTNFTESRWIENPAMIWSAIGSGALILDKKLPDDSGESHRLKKQEVLKQLNVLQKPFFNLLLKSTIDYLTMREKISLLLSDDTYQFRRLVLSIGRDLVRKKILEKPDDVFYLFFDELKTIAKDGIKSDNLPEKIAERKNAIKADAGFVPDDTVCGEQKMSIPVEKEYSSRFLTGICGSSGYKEGSAYVVENPQNVDKILTSDDILVVPFTHVGWTPLFSKIGGIIAENGGQMSHTSIIAREYGIPALVNVRQAMRLIKTGQQLILDANQNRIYLQSADSKKGE